MLRRWMYILVILVLVLAGLGAAGYAGLQYYQRTRDAQNLANADQAAQQGKWLQAARNYGLYLNNRRHRDEVPVLIKYAEASAQIPGNRPKALRDAVTAYGQVLQYEPDNQTVQKKLLDILAHTQDWPDLQYYAENILQKHPEDLYAKFCRALALDSLKRQDDAVAAYKELINAKTDNMAVYGNLARMLRDRGFEQQAQQTLDDAVQQHPDKAGIYLERSKYARAAGDLNKAGQELEQALQRAPDDPDVLMEDAEQSVIRRDWDRALANCEKVIEEAPDKPGAYVVENVVYQNKADLPSAIKALKRAPEAVRRDNQVLYYSLAEVLISANQLDEARECLKEYRDAYPDNRDVFEYFEARLMLVTGDATGAETKLATLVQQRPDLGPARFLLGVAYLRTGQSERARNVLEAYLKAYPGDEKARALLDMQRAEQRSPEEARQALQTALSSDPVQAADLVAAASVLLGASRRNGAVESDLDSLTGALEKAIERDPKQGSPYRCLADVYIAVHDSQKAGQALDRGVAAGVPEDQFYLSRAAVAMEEKNSDAAWAQFTKALAQDTVTADDIRTWASFFAVHDNPKMAVDVLSRGIEKMEGTQRIELQTEKVGMLAEAGQADAALQLLSDLQASAEAAQIVAASLSTAKLQIAQRLLLEDSTDEHGRAAQLIAEVEKLDPKNTAAQTLHAQMLLQQVPPKLDEAQGILEQVTDADGRDVNVLLWLAEIAMRKGDRDKAAAYVQRIAAGATDRDATQLRLAGIQVELKQNADAQRILERLLDKNPENAEALQLLVASYLDSGRVEQAEKRMAELEKLAANDAKLTDWLASTRGKLMVAKGDASSAEIVLREQVKKNPDDLGALESLAVALRQQNRAEEGVALLKDYTQRHSEAVAGWLALARFHLGAPGDAESTSAAEALTRVLLLEANNAEALRDMIQVYVRRQNPVEALALCERYLKERPEDADVLFQKATIQAHNRATLPDALESVSKALTIKNESSYVSLRGFILLGLGQYQKALDDLQPLANAQRVTSAQLDAALAEAYLGLNNIELARTYYESARGKVAQGDPADPDRLSRLKERLK